MSRQCMRPGCDRRATACLTYDADRSEVWLQDPRVDDEPAQVVCSLHAETLTVPLGWKVTDRRSTAAGPMEPPAGPGTGSGATAHPEPQPAPEPESAPFTEVDRDPAGTEPAGEGEGPAVRADEPAVAADAGAGVPGADVAAEVGTRKVPKRPKPKRNSLLDRAFEWTGPQHSVLTTQSPAEAEDDPAAGD